MPVVQSMAAKMLNSRHLSASLSNPTWWIDTQGGVISVRLVSVGSIFEQTVRRGTAPHSKLIFSHSFSLSENFCRVCR